MCCAVVSLFVVTSQSEIARIILDSAVTRQLSCDQNASPGCCCTEACGALSAVHCSSPAGPSSSSGGGGATSSQGGLQHTCGRFALAASGLPRMFACPRQPVVVAALASSYACLLCCCVAALHNHRHLSTCVIVCCCSCSELLHTAG
jgi:hypothetical protein